MPQNGTGKQEVALITGATHGIGLALAQKLLSKGMIVIGIGRDQGSLDKLKSQYQNFIPINAGNIFTIYDISHQEKWLDKEKGDFVPPFPFDPKTQDVEIRASL